MDRGLSRRMGVRLAYRGSRGEGGSSEPRSRRVTDPEGGRSPLSNECQTSCSARPSMGHGGSQSIPKNARCPSLPVALSESGEDSEMARV
jgi:hypothetical protein